MTQSSDRPVKRLTVSPLRYPGGKGMLYPHLRKLLHDNDLIDATYVEPYAGGAGAAVSLLVTQQVRRIVINDLDPAIYSFWRSVIDEPDDFAHLTRDAVLTVDEWRRQKEVYSGADHKNYLRLGFATFYLNRTNRSGILNGGPIGGLDQTGPYKIDARFNKPALLERLHLIKLHANRISVLRWDGIKVIGRYGPIPNTFMYVDPPYFGKAGSLYMNSFKQKDHVALAKCLNAIPNAKWLLTYDHDPQVAQLYDQRRRLLFSVRYSARKVTIAEEVMVLSDGLVSSSRGTVVEGPTPG
jgi:DNA adenine methylase